MNRKAIKFLSTSRERRVGRRHSRLDFRCQACLNIRRRNKKQ